MTDPQQSPSLEDTEPLSLKQCEWLTWETGATRDPDDRYYMINERNRAIRSLIKRVREAEGQNAEYVLDAGRLQRKVMEAKAENAKLRARVEELETIAQIAHSSLTYEHEGRAKGIPDTDNLIRCTMPGSLFHMLEAALSPTADSEKET